MPVMSAEALLAFLNEHFPQTAAQGFQIDALEAGRIVLRLPFDTTHLRPGGTMSGPAMMSLADTAMWLLLLSEKGPDTRSATANLNITFLERPAPGDLVARGEMLRLGARLAVGDVRIFSGDEPRPVAQATVTYALSGG